MDLKVILETFKKNVGFKTPIVIFILGLTLFSLFTVIPYNSTNNSFNPVPLLESTESFTTKIIQNGLLVNILFFISAFVFQIFLDKFLKTKVKFAQILLFYGISGILIFTMLSLLVLLQQFVNSTDIEYSSLINSFLGFLLALLIIHLLVTILRVLLNNFSYPKTLGVLFAMFIITTNLGIIAIFPYMIIVKVTGFANTPSMYSSYNLTNNSDGSIIATYAGLFNSTKKLGEVCYIFFPKGWELADYNLTEELMKKELNRTMSKYYLNDVYYKNDNVSYSPIKYFIFTLDPPREFGGNILKSHRKEHALADKEKGVIIKYKFKIEDATYIELNNNMIFSDIKMYDLKKTVSRHEINALSYNGIGYEAIYQSPYGQDQDLYYILNNTECYKYY